jgi:hypothetical protein
MADVTPASPTLQGIPPELRNKIYDHLLTEPRNVSGRQLLKLRTQSRGSDLWKQFQSSIVPHSLTMTCRQMRTEFGSVLATIAGQNYHLIVDNLDPHQLAVFRDFIATYCFSYKTSDRNFPPLLFQEVVLCLSLDHNILSSIMAYRFVAHVQPRSCYGTVTRDCSGVKFMLKDGSSVYDDPTGQNKFTTKEQAKLAKVALCGILEHYQLYEPDQTVMRYLLSRLTEMADNKH